VVQFPAGLLQSDSAVDKLQEFKMKEDFAEKSKVRENVSACNKSLFDFFKTIMALPHRSLQLCGLLHSPRLYLYENINNLELIVIINVLVKWR